MSDMRNPRLFLRRALSGDSIGYRAAPVLMVLVPVIACLFLQAILGSSAPIIILVLFSTIAVMVPVGIYGLNLYTLLPVIFFIRYEGVAVFAKTVFGQPLQTFLSFPSESYTYTAGLLVIVASTCLLVSATDKGGTSLLKEPAEGGNLRRLGLTSAAVGLVGSILAVATTSRTAGVNSTSSLFPIASSMQAMFPLGIILEATYNLRASAGRRIYSGPLLGMLALSLFQALAMSARILFVSSIVSLVLVLITRRKFALRYVVAGVAIAAVFFLVISPVVLAVRAYRFSGSATEFLSSGGAVAIQAISDPEYLSTLKAGQQAAERYRSSERSFDYYGNQSNVLNRLSWVALVDQIYSASHGSKPLGMDAVPESVERLLPRFLYPDKSNRAYTYSDWLSYQIGIEREGEAKALSFPLSLEGLVVAGPVGFALFTFIGMFITLFVFTRLASWRDVGGFTLFFYTIIQTPILEGNSDSIMGLLTRELPLIVIMCLVLQKLSRLSTFAGRPNASRAPGFRTILARPRRPLIKGRAK